MEEINDTEVPLSNREVLKVLKARNSNDSVQAGTDNSKCAEMIAYLESVIKISNKYPLETLRDLKTRENLDASLNTLAILANTNDLSIVSPSDRKRIIKHCP
jgi:hypothetical protein